MTIEEINELTVDDLKDALTVRIGKESKDITPQEYEGEFLKYQSELRADVKRSMFKDVYLLMHDQGSTQPNPAIWLKQFSEVELDTLLLRDAELYKTFVEDTMYKRNRKKAYPSFDRVMEALIEAQEATQHF